MKSQRPKVLDSSRSTSGGVGSYSLLKKASFAQKVVSLPYVFIGLSVRYEG